MFRFFLLLHILSRQNGKDFSDPMKFDKIMLKKYKVSVILHEQNRGRITVTKQMAQALLRRINKTISGVI